MANYTFKEEDFSSINKDIEIAVITAEFNSDYTKRLEDINVEYLKELGFKNIKTFSVPGALEIPAMAKRVLDNFDSDLLLAFGVVVRGETTHYELVTEETARGLMDVSLEYFDSAVINGVLTCENYEQVEARLKPVYALSGLKLIKECQKIK